MKISLIISKLRASQKWLQDDNIISDRTLYSMVASKASVLMKREINNRRLLNSDNIFKSFECLNLKKVPLTECHADCGKGSARRSEKLPKLEEGINNYTIQGVYNIDNSDEIFPTSTREYINISKLRHKPNKIYYIIKNGFLYVLNEDIENVNIYLYTTELLPDSICDSAYDCEFRFPPYLEDSLYQMIAADLVNYHRTGYDTSDNNKDEGNQQGS